MWYARRRCKAEASSLYRIMQENLKVLTEVRYNKKAYPLREKLDKAADVQYSYCEGAALKVSVKQISVDKEERAIIQCYEVNDDVKSIVSFIKSTNATLAGYIDERASQVPLQDVFFVEAVDNKVFAYTAKKVYELKCKLYEFETQYENRRFFRCSKSFVVNLMKINSVRPILNGRFSATLFNGEEVIISRQYVPELKKRLLGENI